MKVSFFVSILSVIIGLTFSSVLTSRAQGYFGTNSPGAPSNHVAVAPTPLPSPEVLVTAKNIKIITSVWGSEHKFVDVTDRLAEVLSHPDQEFEIGPEWLRADPAPTWKKVLVTVFDVNGTRYVMGNHEGIKLSVHKFQEHVQTHPVAAAAKSP